MPRKTNKTSHVLNLITNGAPEAEEAQETPEAKASAEPAAPAKDAGAAKDTGVIQPEGQKAAPENKVIVVNETSENEKLSNEIKNRLETRLEAEIAQERGTAEAPAAEADLTESKEEPPAAEPVESAATDIGGKDEKTAEKEAEPAETQKTAETAKDSEKKTAEPPADKQEKKPEEKTYHMLNVMERLLNDMNLDEQMEQYGMCRCSRCKADVQALVLTKLPAKYVIVDNTETSPLIGFYKGSFHVRIFTEIMKACMTVKESPRH